MFKTVPQKTFICSIQGDYSKAKDNNMVLNCSPQVVCPPLNPPRTVLLDWYYRRSVRRDQGLWTLSTSAGGEQLSVGFQSWHFGWRLGIKRILWLPDLFWEVAPGLLPQRVEKEPGVYVHQHQGVCAESKRALRTVRKSIHLNMRGQENLDSFILYFLLVQGRRF